MQYAFKSFCKYISYYKKVKKQPPNEISTDNGAIFKRVIIELRLANYLSK